MTLTAPLVDSLLQKYWFVQVLMTNPLESVYGNDAGNHGGNHPEMGIPGIPGIYDLLLSGYSLCRRGLYHATELSSGVHCAVCIR